MSRTSALKVLDHAMVGVEGYDNCQKFVDILGLRSISPLFMKTPQAHKKAGPNRQELEGLGRSILVNSVGVRPMLWTLVVGNSSLNQ